MSVAVVTTATAMGGDSKSTIHPFFNKGPKPLQTSSIAAKSTLPTDKAVPKSSNSAPVNNELPTAKTSRTTRANTKAKRSANPSSSADSNTSLANDHSDAAQSLEVDPNSGRRKRQKRTYVDEEEDGLQQSSPTSPRSTNGEVGHKDGLSWMAELEAAAADDSKKTSSIKHQSPAPKDQRSETDVEKTSLSQETSQLQVLDESSPTVSNQQALVATMDESVQPSTALPAVKLLFLNSKTGTIGSPPKKPAKVEKVPKAKTSVSTRAKTPKSLIVVVKYNVLSKSALGGKIDGILKGAMSIEPQSSEAPRTLRKKPTKQAKIGEPSSETSNPAKLPKLDQAPKATHPFFLGKAAPIVPTEGPTPKEKEPVASPPPAETLPLPDGKSRTIGRVSPIKKPNPKNNFTGFGYAQPRTVKSPGELLPAWPWRGMVHLRGRDDNDPLPDAPVLYPPPKSGKKSKGSAIQVLAKEDLLTTFSAKHAIGHLADELEATNIDQHKQPPRVLRLPNKDFKSGYKLQRQIRSQILTQLPRIESVHDDSSSDDEIQGNGRAKSRVHPAISSVYNSIATSLSAFDKSECEAQSWVQKYAPSSANEVLQSGREAIILRDWLQTLTVKLVDTGHKENKATSSTRSGKGPSKKKKKTSKDMGGFVVASDEEDNEMDEISDPEDQFHHAGFRDGIQKTVVRSGDAGGKGLGKLTNTVVISGPCGSGKTAAVHAVAKELDFEIFEVNPGSRRSGKDILEKVGDMSRNHLVQSSVGNQVSPDDEMQRISDALDHDLKSGRQGTMNSFFKPATTEPKSKSKNTKTKVVSTEDAKPIPKKQKQSVILIEEVDILYEEDKQFWATVIALISQSKRPVIMTCNDESVVPLQSLSLHAIIRFTPPPVDLAVDYMLLVAANEGHLLQRDAIKALYESRGLDLRGSLTELQLWCQFAVGDSRNGVDWRVTRWPPGCDRDSHGNTLRTISEGTYDTGMGWLSRDFSDENEAVLDVEEETLRQAWYGWQVDVGDWHETFNTTKWAENLQSRLKCKADEQEALKMYEYFANAMSISDMCAGYEFASENKALLDVTAPKLLQRVRDEYTLGYQLLHADKLVSHESLGSDISLWLKSRARENLLVDQIHEKWKVPVEMNCCPSETQVIEKIRRARSSRDDFLTRRDLGIAFDPIAEPEKKHVWSPSSLEPSVFDRTTTLIILDVAPFVRSIVSYDARLQQERLRLSNLTSMGGRAGKRKIRSTRAANAALEGGTRKTTRPDRYFGDLLNSELVLRTGKQIWQDAVTSSEELVSSTGGGSPSADE